MQHVNSTAMCHECLNSNETQHDENPHAYTHGINRSIDLAVASGAGIT